MMRIKRWWQTEPAITQVLLGITVAVFLVEWLMGDGAMLIFNSLGAKNNQAIAAGQWWRLVTPMFLHMGLTHIALNGVVIYFMGMQIEAMYGHWRMLAIYILGGISGNIMSFALSNNQSVGASTACFALFGAFSDDWGIVLGKSSDSPAHEPIFTTNRFEFSIRYVLEWH